MDSNAEGQKEGKKLKKEKKLSTIRKIIEEGS